MHHIFSGPIFYSLRYPVQARLLRIVHVLFHSEERSNYMADPRAVIPPFKINTKMARSGVDQSNIVDGRRTRSRGSGKKNFASFRFRRDYPP